LDVVEVMNAAYSARRVLELGSAGGLFGLAAEQAEAQCEDAPAVKREAEEDWADAKAAY
jgi:predicted nicotinamide N-methyase